MCATNPNDASLAEDSTAIEGDVKDTGGSEATDGSENDSDVAQPDVAELDAAPEPDVTEPDIPDSTDDDDILEPEDIAEPAPDTSDDLLAFLDVGPEDAAIDVDLAPDSTDDAGLPAPDETAEPPQDTLPDVAPTSGSVVGLVESQVDGSPVYGATVYIKGTLAVAPTDSDGIFSLQDVPAGVHVLGVLAPGFAALSTAVVVVAGTTTDVGALQLTGLGLTGSVAGYARLVGMADHSGILVTALGTGIETKTGVDGAYVLGGIPIGYHELQFEHEGYVPRVADGMAVLPGVLPVDAVVLTRTFELPIVVQGSFSMTQDGTALLARGPCTLPGCSVGSDLMRIPIAAPESSTLVATQVSWSQEVSGSTELLWAATDGEVISLLPGGDPVVVGAINPSTSPVVLPNLGRALLNDSKNWRTYDLGSQASSEILLAGTSPQYWSWGTLCHFMALATTDSGWVLLNEEGVVTSGTSRVKQAKSLYTKDSCHGLAWVDGEGIWLHRTAGETTQLEASKDYPNSTLSGDPQSLWRNSADGRHVLYVGGCSSVVNKSCPGGVLRYLAVEGLGGTIDVGPASSIHNAWFSASHIYVIALVDDVYALYAIPVSTGAPVLLSSAVKTPSAVAVGAEAACWVEADGVHGAFGTVATWLATGTPSQLFEANGRCAWIGSCVDGQYCIHVADPATGQVVAVGGGADDLHLSVLPSGTSLLASRHSKPVQSQNWGSIVELALVGPGSGNPEWTSLLTVEAPGKALYWVASRPGLASTYFAFGSALHELIDASSSVVWDEGAGNTGSQLLWNTSFPDGPLNPEATRLLFQASCGAAWCVLEHTPGTGKPPVVVTDDGPTYDYFSMSWQKNLDRALFCGKKLTIPSQLPWQKTAGNLYMYDAGGPGGPAELAAETVVACSYAVLPTTPRVVFRSPVSANQPFIPEDFAVIRDVTSGETTILDHGVDTFTIPYPPVDGVVVIRRTDGTYWLWSEAALK